MKGKILLLATVMAIIMLFSPGTSKAITISFDPLSQDVILGDQVVVDLVISGLGDYSAPSLSEFDLDILYDPTILSFDTYSLGSYLGASIGPIGDPFSDAWDLSWGEIVLGDVNIAELSFLSPLDLNSLQPSSFTLATLTFDTLSLGTSSLDISINTLGDEWGDRLCDDPYDPSKPSCASFVTKGSVNVVPEPGTLLLVGSGLLGVGYLRRRLR